MLTNLLRSVKKVGQGDREAPVTHAKQPIVQGYSNERDGGSQAHHSVVGLRLLDLSPVPVVDETKGLPLHDRESSRASEGHLP